VVATFTVYLPDGLLARVDELRGSMSRSGFIRAQLEVLGPHVAPVVGAVVSGDFGPVDEGVVVETVRPSEVVSRSEAFARATQNP
jgi:metal-responsive CopG/Arc/MetJ family transcriptional regulator